MYKPELMSPAGHWPQLEAAMAAGADAVYFGLQHFSARAKVGFSIEELPRVIETLHRNSIKGFVTFNTLVFDHEIDQAIETLHRIAESGADAVIVQDIGVARLANEVIPGLEIHGSTQMSITSAEGAELAKQFGCSRVVLGRELSLKDIRKIADSTEMELEVFVHGALCVSYSGQCFSSEAWGGRSANRGQCAQACRLSYDLIVDGERKDLGDARYLLSPGDLYALEQIPELVEIGVDCFKIEGRYKGPEYVALTTKAYRSAIDRYYDQSIEATVSKNQLEQIYSRGLAPHFIHGVNHQSVVKGRAPRHRGLKLGRLDQVFEDSVLVTSSIEICRGDGIVFDSADWRSPDETEEGGNVYDVKLIGSNVWQLYFGHGDLDFSRIRVGDWLWRTSDSKTQKIARAISKQRPATTGIRFSLLAAPNQTLRLTAITERGEKAFFESHEVLSVAKNRVLDQKSAIEQLSRLGGTPFHFAELNFDSSSEVFCPVSWLNNARREIVQQLVMQRVHSQTHVERRPPNRMRNKNDQMVEANNHRSQSNPQLHCLVRNDEQLSAVLAVHPASITLDYLELYGLRPSIEKIKAAGIPARVASPRILKPSEQKIARFLLSLECSILVRSGGLLHDLMRLNQSGNFTQDFPELHGDFSLNAANTLSFESYFELGLSRLTPTYDLNADHIRELGSTIDESRIELVAFHQLPVFHTEHCVFCRFLSGGTDHTNCGHPCEKHRVAIQDSSGRMHPVMADVGCRNTVFGAEAQFDASSFESWNRAKFQHFRIEFVHQNGPQSSAIARAFSDYFHAEIDLSELEGICKTHAGQGTTTGSLYVPINYKQLVQLS